MAKPVHRTPATKMRDLATRLETLAYHMDEPSRSTVRSDLLIAEAESISEDVRAVVRGGRSC